MQRKRIMIIIILLLSALLLAACGRMIQTEPYIKDNGSATAKFTVGKLKTADFLRQIGDSVSKADITATLNADDEVFVTVRLGEGIEKVRPAGMSASEFALSPEGKALIESGRAAQRNIFAEIKESGISAEFRHSYSILQNGFSVRIKYGDIARIEALPGVEKVIVSEQYAIPEVTSLDIARSFASTGIFDNPTSYSGAGTIIAVIDTGVDVGHDAFAKAPVSPLLKYEDLDGILPLTNASYIYGGLTADDVYYSSKVPFGFNYIDENLEYSPDDYDAVYNGHIHGTHVAGIALGNDSMIKGAAYDAQLAVMRVFGNNGGAYDVDIYAAVEDCVILGVTVANLSLGSPCGLTYPKGADRQYVKEILVNAERAGLMVVCASGNDGTAWWFEDTLDSFSSTEDPDNGVVAAPASFSTTFAVGSAENLVKVFFELDGRRIIGRNGVIDSETNRTADFLDVLYGKDEAIFEYIIVPGVGKPEDFEGIDLTGKIAVIKRGEIAFADKVKNAAENGAVGCILYDNVSEFVEKFGAIVGENAIPTMTVTLEDGIKLVNAENKKITVRSGSYKVDYSYSSSMGALSDLSIGIDVLGVGGSVYSAINRNYAEYNGMSAAYGTMSGTSMATPNASGVMAALAGYLKTAYPKLTNGQIMAAAYQRLMSTANIMVNEDGNPYTPRRQGAGIADVGKAIETQAYLTVTGSNKTKLNLGSDLDKDGVYTLRYNLVNDGTEARGYSLKTLVFTESAINAYSIGYKRKGPDAMVIAEKAYMFEDAEITYFVNGKKLDGNEITVKGGEELAIKVVIKLADEHKAYMDETFKNGIYVEGYSVLEATDGEKIDLSIPFISFYGDWYGLPAFEPTIFDDEAPTWETYSGLGLVYWTEIGGGWWSGTRFVAGSYHYNVPEGYETPAASPDKAAIGRGATPAGNWTGEVVAEYLFIATKRTASTLYVDFVRKDTGEIIGSSSFIGVGKPSVATGGGYTLEFGSYLLPEAGMFANNEEILVRMTYDFDDKPVGQVLEMPIYVDLEAPTLEKAEWRKEDGRTYLDLTVFDNHYLMATGLMTYGTEDSYAALYEDAFPAYGEKGASYGYTIDVTDHLPAVVNNLFAITLIDYANNRSVYEIELPDDDKTENSSDALSLKGRDIYVVYQSSDTVIYGDRNDPMFREIHSTVSRNPLNGSGSVITNNDEGPEFVIEDGVLVAYNGQGGEVVVPDGVKAIGDAVFAGLPSVTKITLPEGLERIGVGSIYRLANLTELVLPSTLKEIEGSYDYSSVSGLPKLTKSNLEDTNLSYAYEAFNGLSSLESITFPAADAPLSLSKSLLVNANLKTVVFNGEIEIIDDAVAMNDSLVSVEFFGKVGGINGSSAGTLAFTSSAKLEKVVFHEEVGNIGYTRILAFWGLKFKTFGRAFTALPSLKEVIFEKDVGNFDGMAFSGCSNLSSVVFGGKVGTIGSAAFGNDPQLKGGFTVAENNEYLVRDETTGMVYDKDMTRMIKPFDWDYDGIFTVPETVTALNAYEFSTPEIIPGGGTFYYGVNENLEYFYQVFGMSTYPKYTKTLMKGVVLNDNITELPEFCFYANENLSEINLDKITRFGASALSSSGITSLVIPDTAEFVGGFLVYQCKKLTDVKLSDKPEYESFEYFFAGTGLKEIELPEFIDKVADYMFDDCQYLEKVTLLADVEYIGYASFRATYSLDELIGFDKVTDLGVMSFNASAIKNISMPSVEYIRYAAFYNCMYLETVDFGESLKELVPYYGTDYEQFVNCESLRSFYIPAGLAAFDIGDVFAGCKSLEAVNVHEDNPYYSSVDGVLFNSAETSILLYPAASKNVEFEVPETVTAIGDNVFANAVLLEKVTMPSVSTLGKAVFANSGVKEIIIGEALEAVPAYTFYNTPLEIIDLDSVKEIGEFAFYNTKLASVTLKKLEYIEDRAFVNIDTLKTLTLGNVVEFNFSRVFFGCTGLENVILENNSAFAYENNLLMNAAKTVVFRYTGKAAEVTVPEGVIKIDGDAFRNNMNLKSLELPKSLRFIGDGAFYGCENLKEITFKSEKAPILQSYFREGARYLYNQFVMNLDDTEMPLEITVYCNGDKSFMTPIWKMYFKNIMKMS